MLKRTAPLALLLVPLILNSCLSQRGAGSILDGRPIVLVENGAWCWYQDERAIVDTQHPNGPLLLVSSVAFDRPGTPIEGDCNVSWCNLNNAEVGHFELHNRFEPDDHDNAALWIRPDGRYLAVYTKHSTDHFIRWRVSSHPHDPTSWGAESTFKNSTEVCYSNVIPLAQANGNDRLYNFSRSDGFDPNWFFSDDQGQTWNYGGRLLTGPRGNQAHRQRPYLKYSSHGKDAIHFIATEGHPQEQDTGVSHGFLKGETLFTSAGEPLGALSETRESPYKSTDFTPVFTSGTRFGEDVLSHAWTIDLEVDEDGFPYAAMCARAKGNYRDHRFLYSRWDGTRWNTVQIAKAGSFLYEGQLDYTGLIALHPHDPNTLVISTSVDPRDDTILARYEIFLGQTEDGGQTWSWAPITWNSSRDNLRPIIPRWDKDHTALLWLRGRIHSYRSWDSEVVLRAIETKNIRDLVFPDEDEVSSRK